MSDKLISQYDEMGESYVSNQQQFFADKTDWTRVKLQKHLKNIQGKKVLDIGCGSGTDIKWCEAQGADVYGIDPSRKMCKLSRQNVKIPERIKEGSYEDIPFDENSFDIVMGRFSLHYLSDLTKAYQEMARVLKKGGVLLLVVSHPTFDAIALTESSDKSLISVKLYDGKVTVQFPPHQLPEYFSSAFLNFFDLQELAESESVDAENPHKLPETLFYKAIKR